MDNYIKNTLATILSLVTLVSCSDLLNQEPQSKIVPSDYYVTADQVQSCVDKIYQDVLPAHTGSYGTFGFDIDTDNEAYVTPSSKYAKGQWKVKMDDTSNWSWDNVRNINYQLNSILNNYNAGKINGTDKNIRQYIGELYFLRAYSYFTLLQKYGDLPIIRQAFIDDKDILIAASKRSPRNEVSRFIIQDLDSAVLMMTENFESRHTRISTDVANLFKSRVALYEASWLTNFKGTAFVPCGEGWPGAKKDYNSNYQYPTGNIDNEITYFLNEAVSSSQIIAEKYKGSLVKNTGIIPQSETDPVNPYFAMFGNLDMSPYPEVLLWREYNYSLGLANSVEVAVERGNSRDGITRSMVESFLMTDGKPIYAKHSGYIYDDNSLSKIKQNRDPRIVVFLKEPGQINCFKNLNSSRGTMFVRVEPKPDITTGSYDELYLSGYALRKGGTFDMEQCNKGQCSTAAIIFRASEALLNYIEAEYMLKGDINSGHILEYWETIRTKAGFTGSAIDPRVTIAATDMNQETLDWGAYTAGKLLTDVTLYNIRRERRCELMVEGLRWMDVTRWRSLDQIINTPYHIEGFKLWNSDMTSWYNFTEKDYNGTSNAKTSSPQLSNYLRIYEKNMTSGNLYKNGYSWSMAQYLYPLPVKDFLLTSSDNSSIDLSPLYQNPYWPTTADMPAEK